MAIMTPQIKQRIEQIRRGEVPEGYKKAKAGIIPLEWEIHKLSKHLTESRIPGSNGAVAKKITVKLWNKGVFEKHELHEGSESTTYYKRKSGQFIYSKLDFLNCAFGIIPEHLDGYESTQDLPCFDVEGVIPYYLLTYVTQRNFYTHFGMIADGGRKARRVGPEDMLSFPLVYPPLAEQEKIAEILQTQDKVISLKEKLIEEKKRRKKHIVHEILSQKIKLKKQDGSKYPQWDINNIGTYLTSRNAKQIPTEDAPLMAFVADAGVVPKGERYDRSFLVKSDEKEYKKTELNDFIYSSNNLDVGSIGLNNYGSAVISVVYEIFSVNSNAIPIVISEIIQMKSNINKILKYRQGALYGQYRIFAEDFLSVTIAVPSFEEQQEIAKIMLSLEKEIELLQKELDQEKQKKKALMQLLLTGIVRVQENE